MAWTGIDISVACGPEEVAFSFDGISGRISFSDLYFEGSVIQFEQAEIGGGQIDANGKFFTWRKKNPIVFTISLIPGSVSDLTLQNAMEACLDDTGKQVVIKSGFIKYSTGDKMTLTNGTVTAWMAGIGANGDNRLAAKTYRFMFERISS